MVYQADFSDWPPSAATQGCDTRGYSDLKRNEYNVEGDCTAFMLVNQSFEGNFDYRVASKKTAGHDLVGYGIFAFHDVAPGVQKRYILVISGAGQYSFFDYLYDQGNPASSIEITWRYSPAVNRGDNASNNFRMIKNGNRLAFGLNNQLMHDSSGSFGNNPVRIGFGLLVQPIFNESTGQTFVPNARVAFSRLAVYKPDKRLRHPIFNIPIR